MLSGARNLAEVVAALEILGLVPGSTLAPFRIVTADPTLTVPTKEEIVVWDRQATNEGHIWYISGQNGVGTWSFFKLNRWFDT